MKKLLTILITVIIVAGFCTLSVSAQQLVDVKLNGVEVDFDVPAQVINDRTLVPVRGIFESMGATVNWDGDTETVTAKRGDTLISMQIGSTSLFVNGVEKIIDVPAQLVNDRTLVPARAVAESFGAKVDWDEVNQTVIIADSESPDFKSLITKCFAENETTINSVEFGFDVDFGVTSEGESVNLDIQADLLITDEPDAMKMDIAMDIIGEKRSLTVYGVKENGKEVLYAVDETEYEKEIFKEESANVLVFDLNEKADSLFPVDLLKISSQEKGSTKFVVSIKGAEINDFIVSSGLDAALGEAGLGSLFAEDSEFDMYIWINNNDGLIFRYNFDFVDLIEGILESYDVADEVTIDAADINLEIKSFNEVDEITVPEDIKKNAIDLTSL